MALKPDRSYFVDDDMSFFCYTTGERGKVVVYDTDALGGSGAAMDNPNSRVKILSENDSASGTIPAGIILQDVVNKDLSQTHLNEHKDEVQVGGKVTVVRKGWFVTNCISGTPTVGATAYYSDNSDFTPSSAGNGGVAVGKFLSKLDPDGYAKVQVNL